MPQMIAKTSREIVKEAMVTVPAISAGEALNLVGSPDHVFVDPRDGTEQARTDVIAGAVTSSRGMMEFHIDPECPAHEPEFNQDRTCVFSCGSGGGSALAAKMAMEMGLSPVVNMSGGIGAWKKAGARWSRSWTA